MKLPEAPYTFWDVGGSQQIRHLWHHYYVNTDQLIWCVDASDTKRMGDIRSTPQPLPLITNEELAKAKSSYPPPFGTKEDDHDVNIWKQSLAVYSTSAQEFQQVLRHPSMTRTFVTIIATHTDQSSSIPLTDILARLGCDQLPLDRYTIIACAASLDNRGISTALEWCKHCARMRYAAAWLKPTDAHATPSSSSSSSSAAASSSPTHLPTPVPPSSSSSSSLSSSVSSPPSIPVAPGGL
jgi:hypothetical protein